MKLNATPRHYMPLSQNQSDEDESGPIKEEKRTKLIFKSSFDASIALSKSTVQSQVIKVNSSTLPMSPLRKLAFIISLIMCVLFVVIFVFFIPCSMTTDLNRTFHLIYKWKRIFHNISFTPPLEYVNSNNAGTPLVIIGSTDSDASLIAIQENNGREHWKLHFHSSLLSSLCNVLDVNSDGIPECLVIGKKGLFAAINVEKGTVLWYLHNHSDIINAQSVNGPTIIPDCDNDGTMDIIISYFLDKEDRRSYLAIVSGATGQLIGSLINVPPCKGPISKHFIWKSQNESHIILYCAENGDGNLWMLSLKEVCDSAFKSTNRLSLKNMFRIPPFAREIDIYQPSTALDQIVIVLDGVKFLLLIKSHLTFQLQWKAYVEGEQHMRILTDGYFFKEKNVLVISTVNMSSSKIMGIDLKDGKILAITQLNESIKTGKKLLHYFGDTDGLILKAVTLLPDNMLETKKFNEQDIGINSSAATRNEDMNKVVSKVATTVFKENYILIKFGKVPLLKTIHSEKLVTFCTGSNCYPDSYVRDSTFIVKKSVLNFSFDLLAVSSTMLSANNIEEMVVNFLNLENISSWSSCNN